MKTISITELCRSISSLLGEVEHGARLLITRRGRPVAEISRVSAKPRDREAWRTPGLRLSTTGPGLATAIVEEREDRI